MTETQIKQRIGQMEASIDAMEEHLDDEQFKEYCDAVYTAITFLRIALRNVKQSKEK